MPEIPFCLTVCVFMCNTTASWYPVFRISLPLLSLDCGSGLRPKDTLWRLHNTTRIHYVVVWHNSSSRINWVDLNECQKKPPEQLTSFLFCYSFLSLNRFNRQISEEQSASFRLVAPFRCIKMTQNDWYVLQTVPFEFGLKRSDFQAVFGL